MNKEQILDRLLEDFFSEKLVWRYIEGISIYNISENLAEQIVKLYPDKEAMLGE